MIVEFDKSFYKSLDHVSDKKVFKKIESILLEFEIAEQLNKIRNIKKLTGFVAYYRIRIGDYRLGLELIDKNTVRFLVLAHRKEIYKIFP
jgi:mRNA interferase RelE/StbE